MTFETGCKSGLTSYVRSLQRYPAKVCESDTEHMLIFLGKLRHADFEYGINAADRPP
jgi:hypothetical protein